MIEARGLSKRFHDKKRGEIRAVDNVSFTCQPGKIYGLLGANGAGKTCKLLIGHSPQPVTYESCPYHLFTLTVSEQVPVPGGVLEQSGRK